MMIKPSQLREDIYNLLDEVIATGIPLEIRRKGLVLKVMLDKKASKLSNLKKRNVLSADPNYYIHLDWSKKWKYNG